MSFFGNPGTASGGLFGNTSTTNNATADTGTGLFGSTPAAQPTGGLFGSSATNLATANTTAPAPSGGLFGNATTTPAPSAGGLFGGFNATASTAPGNTFGGSTANTGPSTSTNAASNPLFGGFGTGKPAEQNSSAFKPPTSGFFNQPATSATAGSSIGTAPAAGFFSSAPKPTETAAPVTATTAATSGQPAGGLFGGGLFGGKKADTPAAGSSTPAAANTLSAFNLGGNKDTTAPNAGSTIAPGLFSLGGNKDANKPEEKKDAPAAPSAFNLFGGAKDTSTEKKDAPASTPPFNLFGGPKDTSTEKKDTATAVAAGTSTAQVAKSKDTVSSAALTTAPSTSGALSTAISVPPPSMLRGKTIEEIVNRWTSELETHVREFNKFATEVAVWDRALIENSNNLAALFAAVLAAEREQNDIDQSLDHIEQQQRELSSTLEAYEKVTDEILGGQGGNLRALDTGPADTERDKNYMLATELHGHLDDLSGSLTQMIEQVNGLSISSETKTAGDDPMGQIAQILSSHLESLQWIDGAVRDVEAKVVDVEKRVRGASDGGGAPGGGMKSRGYGLGR